MEGKEGRGVDVEAELLVQGAKGAKEGNDRLKIST